MRLGFTFWLPEHFQDILTKIDQLHDVGVREAILVFGFETASHTTVQPLAPAIGFQNPQDFKAYQAVVKVARAKGWSITVKPQYHSNTIPVEQSWWPGFLQFTGQQATEFFKFHHSFTAGLCAILEPDAVIVGTEMVQMWGYDAEWRRLLAAIPPIQTFGGRPSKVQKLVGCNVWEPLKSHWAFSWGKWLYGEKRLTEMALQMLGFPPELIQYVDSKKLLAGQPSWFSKLDKIGYSAYYAPTMDKPRTVDEIVSIYRKYQPMSFVTIDYPKVCKDWAGKKPWRITETDIPYFFATRQDPQAYRNWWQATLKVWRDTGVQELGVWEDGSWGYWLETMRHP